MKILHTADWHIGKRLHKYDLIDDFSYFLQWLLKTIKEQGVELLLVSGDIFDLANPSSEARAQYYHALLALHQLDCKIILTGGNHDSASMLNAPKELLNALNINIVGGFPDKIKDLIIPLEKNGELVLLVAAVPFLRDTELHKANQGEQYETKAESVEKGIENTFKRVEEYCKENYPDLPVVAMGHLFTAGASSSDSERYIQIGNSAKFEANKFGDYFSYLALGHIHKPQKVSGSFPIYYSGSPIALSFSERKNEKRVLLIDTDKGYEPESIAVPQYRKLIRISGNLEDIKLKLSGLEPKIGVEDLVEIHLKENSYNVSKVQELDYLINDFDLPGYSIVYRRIDFDKTSINTDALYDSGRGLEEFSPHDVFEQIIASGEYDEETKEGLNEAFQILLEEVQQIDMFSYEN